MFTSNSIGSSCGNNNNNNNNKQEDVTVVWNEGVHTNREVTANRPDIIIKNKQDSCNVTLRRVRATIAAVENQ